MAEYFYIGKCDGQKIVDGEPIPLVLRPGPTASGCVDELVSNVATNKAWFEEALLKHSAVLLRGFDVRDAEGFDRVVEAFGWDDLQYVGPAPRTHVYKRVWTANEGPLDQSLYFHHEMVLFKEFPKKLLLFCEVPPPKGGETPIVPSFKITERMLEEFPDAVEEMEAKGLAYSFIVPSRNARRDSTAGRVWEDAFGTSDPTEAEKRANALGMDVEWLVNGVMKTILRPRTLTSVFPQRNGRRMWFNTVVGMHGKDISSAEMADGTEIAADVVKRCGEIIEEESIQFKWEKGDVLVLDNLAVLHGRRPALPPRRVLVVTCK